MKDDLIYLGHIKDSIDAVLDYTKEGRSSFFADRKTQDAVIHNIQIMGEATKRITDRFKSAHSIIPWRQIAGTRDRIVHDYMGVSLKLVWDIVEFELPQIRLAVEAILRGSR